jgi:hypothetical protein
MDGFRRANSPDEGPPPPSNDEHDALVAKWAGVQPKGANDDRRA